MVVKKSKLETSSIIELIAYRDEIFRIVDNYRCLGGNGSDHEQIKRLTEISEKINRQIKKNIDSLCGED